MKPKQGVFWVSPSSGSSGSWSPGNELCCLGMPFPQGRQLPLHSCIDLWWELHARPLISFQAFPGKAAFLQKGCVQASSFLQGAVVPMAAVPREGRDCSLPFGISHPRWENREFAAETNGQEMGSE